MSTGASIGQVLAQSREIDDATHWKREATLGAMMLSAIITELELDDVDVAKGGVTAQDILDRITKKIEEARKNEREVCANLVEEDVLDIRCTVLEADGVVRRTRAAIATSIRSLR